MIKPYDRVLLKSGEAAFIVEVYEQGVAYEADIERDGTTVTDTVKQEDIQAIIQ